MADPVAGLREMRRVTRPGGLVAASVWDYENDRAPISAFWQAVRELDPSSRGYLAAATDAERAELEARCAARLPDGPFTVEAAAWAVTGRA